MKNSLLYLLMVFLLTSCKSEVDKKNTLVEKIAQANGIEHFDEVKELRYTFNVEVNDSLRTSRSWIWKPKEKMATLITDDSTVTYNYRTEAKAHKEVDHRFINDQYWLLFPFHLVWDEMEYEYEENAAAPISGDMMQRVTVKYPDSAGYTPGDVYEIYFEEDYIIREWVYLSGGNRENPFATTWEDYKNFGGIHIAQMHRSRDDSFKLYFSDISID